MSNVVLAARIVIAVLFAVAGISKAVDYRGTRTTLASFGVPTRFVPLGAAALPLVELLTVVLVLVPTTAWWGGLLALVLLSAFTAAVATNLGQGRTPDCHCFGQLSSSAIGPGTLVRNVLFAVPALLIVLFA